MILQLRAAKLEAEHKQKLQQQLQQRQQQRQQLQQPGLQQLELQQQQLPVDVTNIQTSEKPQVDFAAALNQVCFFTTSYPGPFVPAILF